MILEGPYPTQSNRIIRRYEGCENHFIRVDFRDEDRLQYRWSREVDGHPLLRERVGGILKNGFSLGGREFEFLAYSNSSLREHAVWFINPFHHPRFGRVDGKNIREDIIRFDGLGFDELNFDGFSMAFAIPDVSIIIQRYEWDTVPEQDQKLDLFSDGAGTISVALRNHIWSTICAAHPQYRPMNVPPDAVSFELLHVSRVLSSFQFQVRFMSFRGVIAVDPSLDEGRGEIQMCLLHKFKPTEDGSEEAEMVIDQVLRRPQLPDVNK
jgi:RNA-dependent RNA polymerase